MKKSKRTNNLKTDDQAKEFIAHELVKMMNRLIKKDINDDFSCEVVMYLIGSHILDKGDVATFKHIFNQLVEKNQEVFAIDEFDSDDDGVLH